MGLSNERARKSVSRNAEVMINKKTREFYEGKERAEKLINTLKRELDILKNRIKTRERQVNHNA